MLKNLGISYQLNPRLVRGLDYYTYTAFEIISDDLGAQATVCGGGRYDGLVKELGGPDTAAVGWAMGIERLIILLQKLQPLPAPQLDFYLVSRGEKAEQQSVLLAQKLRSAGFSVEIDLSGSAFGKQFKRADRSGAVACLVLGDAEAENETVQLKLLASGEQSAFGQSELLAWLASGQESAFGQSELRAWLASGEQSAFGQSELLAMTKEQQWSLMLSRWLSNQK
jgi:histidyl-tRNA synthetase